LLVTFHQGRAERREKRRTQGKIKIQPFSLERSRRKKRKTLEARDFIVLLGKRLNAVEGEKKNAVFWQRQEKLYRRERGGR